MRKLISRKRFRGVGLTTELTRPRGSVNCDLQKPHAKDAIAARVQRFVGRSRENSQGFVSSVSHDAVSGHSFRKPPTFSVALTLVLRTLDYRR
jgi:hypothetical protein